MSDINVDDLTPDQMKEIIRAQQAKLTERSARATDAYIPDQPGPRRSGPMSQEEIANFQESFNGSIVGSRTSTTPAGGESPAQWSTQDAQRYVRTLLGVRVAAHLAKNSSHALTRKALGDVDWERQ